MEPAEFKGFLAEKYALPPRLQTKAANVAWRSVVPPNETSENLMRRSELIVERRMNNSLLQGFSTKEVDSLITWWQRGDQVLKRAEADVGLYNSFSSSNYEKLFGKHSLRSDVGYEARSAFVETTLRNMRSATEKAWYIEKDNERHALAGSMGTGTYELKLPPMRNMAQLGFLIHEWAHNAGMEDVCSVCSSALFDKASTVTKQNRHELYPLSISKNPPKCQQNGQHGRQVENGGSQFQGYVRATLLATISKHLSVWNADSYRWYCLLFFKEEATSASIAEFGLAPAWG